MHTVVREGHDKIRLVAAVRCVDIHVCAFYGDAVFQQPVIPVCDIRAFIIIAAQPRIGSHRRRRVRGDIYAEVNVIYLAVHCRFFIEAAFQQV